MHTLFNPFDDAEAILQSDFLARAVRSRDSSASVAETFRVLRDSKALVIFRNVRVAELSRRQLDSCLALYE